MILWHLLLVTLKIHDFVLKFSLPKPTHTYLFLEFDIFAFYLIPLSPKNGWKEGYLGFLPVQMLNHLRPNSRGVAYYMPGLSCQSPRVYLISINAAQTKSWPELPALWNKADRLRGCRTYIHISQKCGHTGKVL